MYRAQPRHRTFALLSAVTGAVLLGACAPADAPEADEASMAGGAAGLVALMQEGQPVFGVFSGPKTREQGAAITATDADFVLYSLESGPFDIPTMAEYLDGMREGGGADAVAELPVVLRVPPIEDEAATQAQLDEALPTGIGGIVFPHAARPDQAAASARMMPGAWPQDAEGDLVNILIVEDHEGIENVREIMATPGLSVVFAGPGDLRRAYEGDMEAVENAIQTVLAACKEFGVVCGVTAGVDDIAGRLEEGWGMIIVTQPEAVAVGLEASGRAG